MKRKISIITTNRADYGLLTPLIKQIQKDDNLKLQLIVTGSHLIDKFGSTYKQIQKEFKITQKIKFDLEDSSKFSILKSMSNIMPLLGQCFERLKPDIVVVLGDRFEILSIVSTALIYKIPVAHISGGELTLGAIDDSIRHSITKMSHIHFVATSTYKKRVIQLGEDKKNIFNFGELGLENIKDLKLLSKSKLEKKLKLKFDKTTYLITYHTQTLKTLDDNIKDFKNILKFLSTLKDTTLIFTYSNCDEGGDIFNNMIEKFVKYYQNSYVFTSLGQLNYLSCLKYVDCVVGNSSSGIVEVSSFKKPTINIGNRQKGRMSPKSVINCKATIPSLKKAFLKFQNKKFKLQLKDIKNPYYKQNSSYLTKEVLKNIDLTKIISKEFRDIL